MTESISFVHHRTVIIVSRVQWHDGRLTLDRRLARAENVTRLVTNIDDQRIPTTLTEIVSFDGQDSTTF